MNIEEEIVMSILMNDLNMQMEQESSDEDRCTCDACLSDNSHRICIENFLLNNGVISERDIHDIYLRILGGIYGINPNELVQNPIPQIQPIAQPIATANDYSSDDDDMVNPVEGDYSDSDDSTDRLYDYYDPPRTLNREILNRLNGEIISYSTLRKKLKIKDYVNDCSVCLSGIKPKYGSYKVEQYILLDCNHSYHSDCIIPYLEKYGESCPNCRKAIV